MSSKMLRIFLVLAAALLLSCSAFSPSYQHGRTVVVPRSTILFNSEGDAADESEVSSTKVSLEEKMKGWEATEEEQKAATLGGVVPRGDAFDLGLYILFPFMVISGLAVAFFPLIMGNLDLDSVGLPPTL
jgi:ABC-type glycerol-3-phosphate transport system substrate-binding protein